jgi:hypothetical protein
VWLAGPDRCAARDGARALAPPDAEEGFILLDDGRPFWYWWWFDPPPRG